MKKILLLVAIIISFITGFIISNKIDQSKNIPQVTHKRSVMGANTAFKCTEDLGLDNAKKQLGNNTTAINLIKSNCMWLFGSQTADLEGNGKSDLIFWGSGAGCASCHAQTIYVLSGNKVVFTEEDSDPKIEVKKLDTGKQGLIITRPLIQHNDTYATHVWGLKTTYVWFDSELVIDDESPIQY